VIPALCTLALDIRTLPDIDHDQLIAKIIDRVRRAANWHKIEVEAEVVDDRPAVDTPIDHPVVQALVAAHERVHGTTPPYGGVPGATDGTILSRDAGLATVVYGPGGKWIAHQADEFVEVADVLACARVYAEAARLFLVGH
jgi:succinyl-diaminopimelate desuccinylase